MNKEKNKPNIDMDTPLFHLSIGEFLEMTKEVTKSVLSESEANKSEKTYLYGLAGLSKLLGCSISTASRIKKEGIFDEAIFQQGKLIIIDKEKFIELMKQKKYK
ncbi:DUF3853 family protein [Riemerella columbipharyngis]|uniref:DUF3853 family protein n=1 Tax=Riemerella columbipharyngis TaxID=1071918 RepID=A0A1G6ZDB2_9FLAO|nr:DUF3853 family protein [Riemerella columbipharyngis]SDE00570.1 Protein of unknown function [Riemerella columbipharyngis]